jgi:PAS domain S-box-containing protein
MIAEYLSQECMAADGSKSKVDTVEDLAAELERARTRIAELEAMLLAGTDVFASAEAARDSQAARFRWLPEETGVGLGYWDVDCRVVLFNKLALRNLGCEMKDVLGKSVHELFGEETGNVYAERMREAARGGTSKDYQDFVPLPIGGKWFLSVHSPVRDVQGELLGVQVLSRDITEQKEAEEVVRAKQAELQQRRRLESLGLLAGGVAHDFNNLLTPIISYAELARGPSVSDELREEAFAAIGAAGERARDITRQLLVFSRGHVIEMGKVDLTEVVASYQDTLRHLVREDVEILLSAPSGPAHVAADRSQLGQVLLNLAVNAQDAMPAGGKLEFWTEETMVGEASSYSQELRTGPCVVLTIRDTGVGMNEETRSRMFDPFYSTRGTGKGTGLGLATVHGIIRQHGGWIEVDSAPNKGTTFKIYLPRAGASAQPVQASVPSETLARGTETVLVVEDEPGVRMAACTILSSCGYQIMQAENGEEALTLLTSSERTIDLLLTDLVMPKMGGQALVQALADRQPAPRVLFMSGHAGPQGQELMDHGDAAFLAKPFSAKGLATKVRWTLDRER